MITSSCGVGFIIATPTKCGTTTLEEAARRHRGGRAGIPKDSFRIMDWEKPRRQHRMVPPVGMEGHDRYLLVRNPFSRYVSIFEHLRNEVNYSQWGTRWVQGRGWPGREDVDGAWRDRDPMSYGEFLIFLKRARETLSTPKMLRRRGRMDDPRAYRSPWVWTDSLIQSRHALLGTSSNGRSYTTGLLRLENLWAGLAELNSSYGVGMSVKPSINANRSVRRHPGDGKVVELAVKGDSLTAWDRYYGESVALCIPDQRVCEYGDSWEGGLCPVHALGVHSEAESFGYGGRMEPWYKPLGVRLGGIAP